jgi:choline dehydrogenase
MRPAGGAAGARVVVVGAGSAGLTVAWRLSEDPDTEVIVVEAGPNPGANVPAPLRRGVRIPEQYYWNYRDADDEVFLPRGKVVGGSSAVNGTLAQRGETRDFDEWERVAGPDWTWEQVLPFFNKLERDLEYGGEGDYHGSDGPVPIIRIPRERWPRVAEAFVRACDERGFGFAPDLNRPEATGISPVPRNQDGEYRASTLVT